MISSQSDSLPDAILHLRREFMDRIRQRDAVFDEIHNPESRLAAAPRDIVAYVIMPYIPDLRLGIDWMRVEMAASEKRERDFLHRYSARNRDGEMLQEESFPLLDRDLLEDLISTEPIISDIWVCGKFIGDACVMQTHNTLAIKTDTDRRLEPPHGEVFAGCTYVGGNLLQMEICESGWQASVKMRHYMLIDITNPEIPPEHDYIRPMHVLPCGLVLAEQSGKKVLYDPRNGACATVDFDGSMHYDDFGQSVPMPDYVFHDQFNSAFGMFSIMS